jgi:hypothetical protein
MNKMNSESSFDMAMLDAEAFLKRHGDSLSEVLHSVAGMDGVDIFCAADRALGQMSPNPIRVVRTLYAMRDLLAECTCVDDKYAASVRWHGARLNDLASAMS